jgi:hypothetical protein
MRGNLPVSSARKRDEDGTYRLHRGVGKADPACGRASAAALLPAVGIGMKL